LCARKSKERYGTIGNTGIDPEILLKLMFLLYWDDVRSERELMQILPERLDYLWFLGYSLDDDNSDAKVTQYDRFKSGPQRNPVSCISFTRSFSRVKNHPGTFHSQFAQHHTSE